MAADDGITWRAFPSFHLTQGDSIKAGSALATADCTGCVPAPLQKLRGKLLLTKPAEKQKNQMQTPGIPGCQDPSRTL